MKRLLSILSFVICSLSVFGQTVPTFPAGLSVQNLGAPTNVVDTRGIHAANAGFAWFGYFSDTTEANTNAFYKNIAGMTIRTGNTVWIRDVTKQYWIEFGAGSLNVDTTESILLRGDGSPPSPLKADLQVSQQSGNILQIFPDGAYATTQTQIQNYRIGGDVIWQTGLTYIVTPATYAIGGVVYNSPLTTITLANADPSLARFDGFVLTTSGTAIALTGTPDANPVNPSYNPTTQLPLTFVQVTAAMTAPAYCRDSIYYPNNGQTWTGTVSNAGRINLTSTSNPYSVTQDIEFTLAQNGDQLRLTKSSTISWSTYSIVGFWIRSKATWAANSKITIQMYNGLTPQGIPVVLGDGIFGFNSSITNAYQYIAIPRQNFGVVVNADNILFTVSTTSNNTIGAYADNIELLGCDGVPVPVTGRFWSQGGDTWGTTGVIGTLDNNNIQVVANNTNQIQIKPDGTSFYQGTNPKLSLLLGTGGIGDIYIQRNGTDLISNTSGSITNKFTGNNIYQFVKTTGHVWNDSLGTFRMGLQPTGELRLGTNVGSASSLLTMNSTTQGLLPPRMTTAQKNAIASPATGLVVYDTDLTSFYYYNGVAWVPFGANITASEGLSKNVNNIEIGGTNSQFTGNRAITTSAFSLTVPSSNATSTLIVTNSSTGQALRVSSTSGTAINVISAASNGLQVGSANIGVNAYGSNTGVLGSSNGTSGIPMNASNTYEGATNDIRIGLLTSRDIGSAGAVGMGISHSFRLTNASITNRTVGAFDVAFTDATNATEDVEFSWRPIFNGTVTRRLQLESNGTLTASGYGAGSITGTGTFALAVTSAGKIIEVALGSGMTNPMTTTGDIIYSADNSGTPARRGIGTAGDVLTVVGGLPVWQAPGVGGTVTSVTGTSNRITITGTPTVAPVVDIAATYVGQASITTLGTITTGVWTGTDIAFANIAQGSARSVLGVTGNATADVASIQGTANQVLVINSAGTALAFGQVNLASSAAVTGALGPTNGGTSFTSYVTGDLIYASSVNTLSKLAIGTVGQILTVNAGGAPVWATTSGTGTMTSAAITQPSAGITVTNSGVAQTTVATWTIALANDLAAVENLATTGIVRRTGTSTWTAGTLVDLTTEVTNTLPTSLGGTGQTTWGNGQIGIGNGTTLTKTTLTAANGISITNGAGSITVSTVFVPTVQTLTDAATITFNVSLGGNSVVTLGGTGRTLSITNPVAGYTYIIRIIQGSGGSKTITTWPIGTKWPGGISPTLSTTVGAVDIVAFYYDGTSYWGIFNSNFS